MKSIVLKEFRLMDAVIMYLKLVFYEKWEKSVQKESSQEKYFETKWSRNTIECGQDIVGKRV